ncbi:uncharacterized protein LOC118181464 [Stegodyphus dumicola]|uniref:uncharacterized protein LOC118181464 n=1 Tax=Stegodyphus dumicola TaxID=202533 RepID=UPI0015AC14FE|nr:uncharacterized protein LOC118181464 [Stegodyphus dumicola]
MCWCRGRFSPQMQCRTRECPQTEISDGDNCHPLYEKDRCCPVGYKCVAATDENDETQEKRICEYNGVFYPLGARVYPSYDPCLICDCVLNDNGDNELHCHKQDCLFERYKSKIDAGCVPVYHEKKCCPVEFHCPETKTLNYTVMENDDALNESDVQSGDHCIFSGKFYKINAEFAVSNPCIKCKCLVPPDFTCIHQSCPPPPNAKNCYASKTTGQCCPYYECLIGDNDANYDWDDVVTEIVCPTPLCADESCHIGIPEGHKCPTCICSAQIIPTTFLDINSSNSENATYPEVDNKEGIEKNDEELKSKNLTNFQDMEELLSNQIAEKDFEKIREDFEISDNHSSGHFQRMVRQEQDQSVLNQQQQQQELNSDTELEREPFSEDQDEYDAELQSFQKSKKNENTDNILGHSTEPISSELVPDGCPTPICENSTCRILIPAGEHCPTCVCESRGDRQP